MGACAFCGRPANTKEHVIPSWLQECFGLRNQRLGLWNRTSIPYRQAVVPACWECNHDRLAPLEKRIQDGRASQRDYYLWALKITYGLGHRDTTLLLDRASPGAGSLVPPEIAEDIGEFARHAFRGVDSPAFRFSPDPFGSVIFLDSGSDEFVFIDIPRPYPAVAVALPDKKRVVVLLDDRGVIAAMCRGRRFKKFMQLALSGVDEQLQLTLKVFLMLTTRSHLGIPRETRLDEHGVFAARVPRKLPTVCQPLELYRGIADMLYLPHTVADKIHARYASGYASAGHVRWR